MRNQVQAIVVQKLGDGPERRVENWISKLTAALMQDVVVPKDTGRRVLTMNTTS